MTTTTRHVGYQHDDLTFAGVLTMAGDGDEPRATVLVFHGMEGRSDAQLDVTKRLTEWGYVGFAVDLFGTEATAAGLEGCGAAMDTFIHDRALLRERLLHVFDVVRSLPEVDVDRVAAIGLCFGGLCVLDLARAGVDTKGVASFHGVLSPPDGMPDNTITAKVNVFHGWDDPFVPPEDVTALGEELSGHGIDWQLHAYGSTMHAFMVPWADDPGAGVQYNESSARRAWTSLESFLSEVLA